MLTNSVFNETNKALIYIYIYTRRLMPPFGRPRCLGISGYAWHAWLRFKLCWSKLWLLALKSIKMSAVCFIRDVAAASGATMSQAPMPPLQIAPKYGRVLNNDFRKSTWSFNDMLTKLGSSYLRQAKFDTLSWTQYQICWFLGPQGAFVSTSLRCW